MGFRVGQRKSRFSVKISSEVNTWRKPLPQAVDGPPIAAHHWAMRPPKLQLELDHKRVVGSFGDAADLLATSLETVRESSDLVEIRLDLLASEATPTGGPLWRHLAEFPLLFTARRGDEGGAGALDPLARMELLQSALGEAAWIDLELASIPEMGALLPELSARGIPWIASYHDFQKLPATAELELAAASAKAAGAAVFKIAAWLASPADMARLAEFQLADHGLPVATMGMGPLAPVSRLLCAQCGSVFNYGYLGGTATAPGQWDAALLKTAISRLAPFPG